MNLCPLYWKSQGISCALESGHPAPAVLFLCTRAYKSLLNKLYLYYAIWPEGENWNWETIFYGHLHQLISQTTQYLDSWLSDLFQSELKMQLLEVEGGTYPIAGDATEPFISRHSSAVCQLSAAYH